MHFYAWKKGLKTGMYYLRTRPKADAIQFTVDQTALAKTKLMDSAKAESAALLKKGLPAAPAVKGPQNENDVNESNRAGMVCALRGLDSAKDSACEMCSA